MWHQVVMKEQGKSLQLLARERVSNHFYIEVLSIVYTTTTLIVDLMIWACPTMFFYSLDFHSMKKYIYMCTCVHNLSMNIVVLEINYLDLILINFLKYLVSRTWGTLNN